MLSNQKRFSYYKRHKISNKPSCNVNDEADLRVWSYRRWARCGAQPAVSNRPVHSRLQPITPQCIAPYNHVFVRLFPRSFPSGRHLQQRQWRACTFPAPGTKRRSGEAPYTSSSFVPAKRRRQHGGSRSASDLQLPGSSSASGR